MTRSHTALRHILMVLILPLTMGACTAFTDTDELVPDEVDPCTQYCNSIQETCVGANAQYSSTSECESACEAFNADGTAGDIDGDTLQCRQSALASAQAGFVEESCAAAGPTGSLTCIDEDPCDLYCADAMSVCVEANSIYPSEEACLQACDRFDFGTPNDTAVDTLHCRVYHLNVARDAPSIHCPHGGPGGGGVCVEDVEDCQDYCGLWFFQCPDAPDYSDRLDCLNKCGLFPGGNPAAPPEGDTFICRAKALERVFREGAPAGIECANAGVDGGQLCSGN